MTDRRRKIFVLLLVAGLLAGSIAVIATKPTRLGLDLKGGVSLIYQAKPTKQTQVTGEAIDRTLDIMRKRVDQLGVAEPEIQRSGADQIDVSLPDVKNADEAAQQVGTTAQMYFYDWEPNVIGPNLKPDPQDPIVTFDFTSKGRAQWQKTTREIAQRGQEQFIPGQSPQNAFQHFAIVLDNELISVPFIDFQQNPDGIDARNGSQIEGGFTIDSAQRLANLLKTGALPIKLALISSSQVSATLGKQALDQGLVAGIAGFAIVAIFLLAFYRILGLIAVGALLVYALYFYALIKLIPITLTLPGIAGLILTIGVAADANIVIFERVKEEIRGGRSIRQGIVTGYRKGLTAIIDANVVTIMTAFILFVLATAEVQGFAFTLGIGTFVSLFTAVMATQAILMTMGRSRLISRPSALGAGGKKRVWRFDFMGASRYFFTMSGAI